MLHTVGLGSRTVCSMPSRRREANSSAWPSPERLVGDPDLLICDEPTGALDTETGDMVADILFRHVRELGVTLILVTHDPQLAARCERRLTIDRGATVVIRMIAKDLRINPLRTSLTALSMFIGIIALIAGVLVGTLGRDYLEAVNARLGASHPPIAPSSTCHHR